ncbi:MAG: ABC transporter permease, partial [Planctomycetales bacterium]|nr:ABC transporter permease [Planctomycetales bacterium]
QGEEDVTVVTQAAMLEVIGSVMGVVTRGVVAIAAVALLVGAMGILTVMWLSVHERTREIGLLKAIGASNPQVMSLFLAEAAFLSTVGGIAGIALGVGGGRLLAAAVPALRVALPPGMIPIQLGVAFAVGLLAGTLPARRAARLDPVEALREE